MSFVETDAYSIAAIALTASCAALLCASRAAPGSRRGIVARVGPWIAAVALLALCIGLAARGAACGRWPLGTFFEFTVAFAASTVLVYLLVRRGQPAPLAEAAVTLLALVVLLRALLGQPGAAGTAQALLPVMGGPWFIRHTLLVAIAYGALAVAGSAGLSAIVAPRRSTAAFVDGAMAVGYVGLSLGMITGGIGGELAWGDYWTWSVKETWTLVTWLACTLYYHVRRRRGWRGTRALIVAVMISVTVCANLFLTPILLRWTRLQRWRIY